MIFPVKTLRHVQSGANRYLWTQLYADFKVLNPRSDFTLEEFKKAMPKTTILQAKEFSQLKWDTAHPVLTKDFVIDNVWDIEAVREAYTLENGGRIFTTEEANYCLNFQPTRPQDFKSSVDKAVDAHGRFKVAFDQLTRTEKEEFVNRVRA